MSAKIAQDTQPQRTRFQTTPPASSKTRRNAPVAGTRRARQPRSAQPSRSRRGGIVALIAVLLLVATLVVIAATSTQTAGSLTLPGATVLSVMLLAVWAWTCTSLDDTLVAFLAAVALIITTVLPAEAFFASLGDETIWLLICAFIIAAGVASSGLALRGAAHLLSRARTVRGLLHLTTLALAITAFAIPATSGRAALALPIFAALAAALRERPALVKALALVIPTVVLLSAVGSLLGAGAHVISAELLESATGSGIGFVEWMWFGLPLAVVSSHLACEIILFRFLSRAERSRPVAVSIDQFQIHAAQPITGPLSVMERRAVWLLLAVVALWCTEPVHHLPAAVVALLGAVAAVSPGVGCTNIAAAVKKVPWGLLLFLAATLALASALTDTGAAVWLGTVALGPLSSLGSSAAVGFIIAVVAISLGAHLLIPSRSARSAAIIPLVIVLAPGVGIDPLAAAFASTAAAGFCHTLTSSAKPVAMFADPEIAPGGFSAGDLRRLSAVLAPAMFVLILCFSFWIWPALGMPLML